jgi:hypothetical protein
MPRTLDGNGQLALVFGTHAGLPSRTNLPTVTDKPTKKVNAFIVYSGRFLTTKITRLPSCCKTAPTALSKVAHSLSP